MTTKTRPLVDLQVLHFLAKVWLWPDHLGSDFTPEQREDRCRRLAEAIQKAIDDWCEDNETPPHRL